MINKKTKTKNNINNILLDSLFKSKNFYGEFFHQTNKDLSPFLYGIRHNYSIINLKYTSFFLKRIFKLLQYTIKNNKKILIIGNSSDIKFLTNKYFIKNNKNLIYFNEDWIHGLITNSIKNRKIFNEVEFIIVIKSTVKENYLNTELSKLQIPIISLINTHQSIKKINYPILTNSKNIKSLYILMYLIRNLF